MFQRLPSLLPLVAVLAGCVPVAEPPDLRSVSPGWGWTGESTLITLTGARFYPEVVVGDQRGESQFDTAFQAFLETDPPTALDPVQFVDTSTLMAEVPSGVAPGVYDLRVLAPSGVATTLGGSSGFRVTETRADHLAFDVETVSYDVTELASIPMHLADPEGGNVAEPMLVQVEATSALGATGLEFGSGLLDNQESIGDGTGVRGNLHADGTATLLLRSSAAQDLTLTLSSVDEPLITSATTLLSFSPGAPDHVVLTLPNANYTTTAGDEVEVGIDVVDALGNVIDATGLSVVLFEDASCGDLRQVVDLLQAGPYPVTLTAACAPDHLHAVGLGQEVISEAFDVLPGPMVAYDVRAAPNAIVAGKGVLAVQLDAVDSYHNVVPDHLASIKLTDSVGGLDPDAGIGTQLCNPFIEGRTVCTATPIRAGSDVTITATDELGRTGVSNGVDVLADTAASVAVSLGTATGEAGVAFTVVVQLLDQWGNPLSYASDAVALTDDTGTLACESTADGNFTCFVTASDPADVITATLFSLTGTSIPLLVTNSDLAQSDVSVTDTEVTAGEAFGATVRGYDRFGNAYTTAVSGSSVTLGDLLGGLVPLAVVLDATGAGTTTLSLTVAGTDAVTASQGGVVVGTSTTITVAPGIMVELTLTAPPWADVDAGVPMSLTAVDTFGNAVGTYSGPVAVTLDGCDAVTATDFVSGEAEVDLVCNTPALQVQIVADDGVFRTVSEPLDLLDFACADGPVADLQLDGAGEVVACLVSGAATLVVDTSGTVSGAAPVAAWLLDDGHQSIRSAAAPTAVTFETPGARRVGLVVADAAACGSEASAVAWVGENDGSPVGPIVVTPTSTAVRNGASTSVSISASDCAGDVASGAYVYVWTSLGVITGATSTGTGLTATLDSLGRGGVFAGFTEGYVGTATVVASSADGSGFGSASIGVTDDSVRPTVVAASPAGEWADLVDAITVEFSEPMRSTSFASTSVVLTGPSGVVTSSLALSADLRTLTVTPSLALDAAAGAYSLTLSTNIRDTAGNRLSGDWSGAAASWSVTFGMVGATVVSGSCTNPTPDFRPDGDEGAGMDAEHVVLSLAAASTPAWWALTVTDGDGAPVRRTRTAGSNLTVSWDGRGDDGVLLGEGVYALSVDAVDATSNEAGACSTTATLSQRGRAP